MNFENETDLRFGRAPRRLGDALDVRQFGRPHRRRFGHRPLDVGRQTLQARLPLFVAPLQYDRPT